MPLTSIKTRDHKKGTDIYIQFFTIPKQEGDGIVVRPSICNEDWKPIAEVEPFLLSEEEEDYHRRLREASVEKGEFVQAYSTNPEWTPGYVEPEKIIDAEL